MSKFLQYVPVAVRRAPED